MRHRRTFGYVLDIQGGKCDKADAPFNFAAAARLLLTPDDGSAGYVWKRARAFSSNFATLTGVSIPEGTISGGIIVDTYGDLLTATFGSLVKSSIAEWRQGGARHPLFAGGRDLDHWFSSPLPALGGAWVATRRENIRIAGAPMQHSTVEFYQCHIKQGGSRKKKDVELSSGSMRRGPTLSRSNLDSGAYDGIRKAHREADTTSARRIRQIEREHFEKIK